ncbi:MAG: hypothetical protein RLY93_06675 [Sumerlaeia bacterium]
MTGHSFTNPQALRWRVFLPLALFALGNLAVPFTAGAKPPEVRQGTSTVKIDPSAIAQPDFSPPRAAAIDDLQQVPPEYWTHASFGDRLLANDRAVLTFGKLPEGEGTEANLYRDGALLDLLPRLSSPEGLQVFLPTTNGMAGATIEWETMESSESPDENLATIVLTGHDTRDENLRVRTEYRMNESMPGALVTTTLTYEGDEQSPIVTPSDYILWGAMQYFVPGIGWIGNSSVTLQADFVFAKYHDTWVLIAPSEGTFEVRTGQRRTAILYDQPAALESGETRIYSRWVLTGASDPATLYSLVLKEREGADFGALVGRVIEREQLADGSLLDKSPVDDCMIRISPLQLPNWSPEEKARIQNRPYLLGMTKPSGQFEALLPVGEWRVLAAPSNRLAPKPTTATRITKDKVTGLDFGVSMTSQFIYQVVDADTGERIPAKITVEPLRGTTSPELGPPGTTEAQNVVFSANGAGIIDLPPGNYRVIASRGPEYNIAEERIQVAKPTLEPVYSVLKLKRAFETPGWISADVGLMTSATAGSRVSPRDRVVSAVAEGVDWIVTGDYGEVTKLSGDIEAMGLDAYLSASPGLRIPATTREAAGDFLFFPLDVCSVGAEPDFTGVFEAANEGDAEAMAQALRAVCPEAVVMLNRPIWPETGFLVRQGYDPDTGGLPEGDWSRDFDVIQIWEGKRQAIYPAGYRAYHELLGEGLRLAAIGNSASMGTWNQEVGYPRIYIPSSTDDPAELNPAELAEAIKRGKVMITNGPFIKVTVNDQPVGSLITDQDGFVDVDLEVFAANWVPVTSISINLNGQFARRIILPQGGEPDDMGRVFPHDKGEDAGKLKIRVSEDSILDVVVSSDVSAKQDPVNPYITPDPAMASRGSGQTSLAISAPVIIDVDGNGIYDPPAKAAKPQQLPYEEDDPIF